MTAEYQREWRKNNPDKVRKYERDRYARSQKLRNYRKKVGKEWRKANTEYTKKYFQAYYAENKAKIIKQATENRYIRIARLNGVERERYTKQQVLDKSKDKCQVCLGLIDVELSFPHPMSFSFNHIYPISKGGIDKLENIEASHLLCNQRLGNRMELA